MTYVHGLSGIESSIKESGKTVAKAIDGLTKAVNNLSKTETPPAPSPVFNVYVTTGGTDTTRDVAKAVQEAIGQVNRHASS